MWQWHASLSNTNSTFSLRGWHGKSEGRPGGRRAPIRMASKCVRSAFTGSVYKPDAAAYWNSHIFLWRCHAEHFQKGKLPGFGSLLFWFLITGGFFFRGWEGGLLFFWNQKGKENRVDFSPTTESLQIPRQSRLLLYIRMAVSSSTGKLITTSTQSSWTAALVLMKTFFLSLYHSFLCKFSIIISVNDK